MKLNVPYKSQWDSDATDSKTDCGPASLAMVIDYFTGKKVKTNEVLAATGAQKDKLISFSQLIEAGKQFGVDLWYTKGRDLAYLEDKLRNGIPLIALVKYKYLISRQDKNYNLGHFLVVVGMDDDAVIVHDPNFWGEFRPHGEYHRYTKQEFLEAWGKNHEDNNPDYSLLVPAKSMTAQNWEEVMKKHGLGANLESLDVALQAWEDVAKNGVYVRKDDCQKQKDEAVKLAVVDVEEKNRASLFGFLDKVNKNYQDGKPDVENYEDVLSLFSRLYKRIEELSKQPGDNLDEVFTSINSYAISAGLDDPKIDSKSKLESFIRSLVDNSVLTAKPEGQTLLERITSRKFLSFIGTLASSVIMGLQGVVEWNMVLISMITISLGYMGINVLDSQVYVNQTKAEVSKIKTLLNTK